MFPLDFEIPADKPVLIAGATASGKSALALELAKTRDGPILNADALQVYDGWRVLTARPNTDEETRHPHHLYGHIPPDRPYSVGDWLRQVTPFLAGPAPIIVGGTGLYFRALTEGLVDIPATPVAVREEANAALAKGGINLLLQDIDDKTRSMIDTLNPMRVQRAWEVARATGRGLADWQAMTPPPTLPLSDCTAILLDADRAWLNDRITRRFDIMLEQGALEEARALAPDFDPDWPSSKAIGAKELIGYVTGACTLASAREAAIIASRQYAKRQRTWFRARMKNWHKIPLP